MFFQKILLFSTIFIMLYACTDPAHYETFNPPVNGVVIEGSANINLSGFQAESLNTSTDLCQDKCYISSSNNMFFTVFGAFSQTLNSSDVYTFRIKADSTEVYYLYYKDSNDNLARDTRTFTNGILPISMSENSPILYLYNGESMITDRGVIFINNGYFKFYFQLKEPIENSLEFCYGTLSKTDGETLQELNNVLCFNNLKLTE